MRGLHYPPPGLFRGTRKRGRGVASLSLFFCIYTSAIEPEPLVSDPVVITADEKGNSVSRKPAYFSIYLGNRFSLPDDNAASSARDFATTNMLRPDEVIYKGSGAALSGAESQSAAEPALRIEWEVPFERISFLPAWSAFSANLSLENAYSATRPVLTSAGNFRYLNPQPTDVALGDVTYTGSLSASEKRHSLTPMLGVGAEFSNATLQRMNELRLFFHVAAGIVLQTGQRNYDLVLNPQYISAGVYSDTYVIKSSITGSYSMAVMPAGRADLGLRMRLSPRLHLSLLGSFTVVYGVLPYDNLGYFREQAGADKNTYQKIVSATSDQDYLGLIPAVFLALSIEL